MPSKSKKMRVWHIPQVPGARFFVCVSSISEAKLVLATLAQYDAFELKNNIKGDYCNTQGLEVFNKREDEWVEWADRAGKDIRGRQT